MGNMAWADTAVTWAYHVAQTYITAIFAPTPPPPKAHFHGPRIAVIGAGISGVSSAAHCIGHGFEVALFEAGSRKNLGGIWARVNNTSSLQIHSMMYRFFPSVNFRKRYPSRERIVEEVTQVWTHYHLDERTYFDVPVKHIWKDDRTGKWIVNNAEHGTFDGVIVAVGTCGEPSIPHIPGQDKFGGNICHSSQLTGKEEQVRGEVVSVVGGGASAVEAVEFAIANKARKVNILARSDKWIIPRNPVVDILLAASPFGEETFLSWIPEELLRRFFYRDLGDLVPPKAGFFTETPMVNDKILDQIRAGRVSWMRGDIYGLKEQGVDFTHRARGVPKGGPGKADVVPAGMIIMATGFHRPSLRFLPDDAFRQDYEPPNWYLQTFPVGHPTICATNCTYVNAIGTVGNVHIGIYARLLMMFVLEPDTRPSDAWMRSWVDTTRILKRGAPGGALNFFTYSELLVWFLLCLALNPTRWKWALFVLAGWGLPLAEKDREVNGEKSSMLAGEGDMLEDAGNML